MTRPAASGSILRQFTEGEQRRHTIRRATKRTSLVIGAGAVPGLNELPGAHEEAAQVHRLLQGAGYEPTLLCDVGGELGLVELSNSLFANYRILHIASHGEYVERDRSSTGAILSRDYVLTAETVRQLPWVPDLVFLNCCKLARVGSLRTAAGLAREFMAIGTRAVIAAGWSIGDPPALAFANEFYDAMLSGVPFGDAVAFGAPSIRAQGGGRRSVVGRLPVLRRPGVRAGRAGVPTWPGSGRSHQPA